MTEGKSAGSYQIDGIIQVDANIIVILANHIPSARLLYSVLFFSTYCFTSEASKFSHPTKILGFNFFSRVSQSNRMWVTLKKGEN